LQKQLDPLRVLSELPYVDYKTVLNMKIQWLRSYFEEVGESGECQNFMQLYPWVEGYALFKVLQGQFPGKECRLWPPAFLSMRPSEYKRLLEHFKRETLFFVWLQHLCYSQWAEVKNYAVKKDVLLMGDLPILISRHSADSWLHGDLFDFHLHAGAPPDMYIQEGQDWGFPLIRWDEMKKDGYAWWKERLRFATPLYDLYRIDHVVGLFRIWGILPGKPPREGRFFPEDPALWEEIGKEVLSIMLEASPLLPVAEDLGTVPDIARVVLNQLSIATTKVMRWERYWDKDGSFIPYELYPYLSLTTVSTHDSETLALWWEKRAEEAKVFASEKGWVYTACLSSQKRFEILRDSHLTGSLLHINLFQEYLALFPELIWPIAEKERINIPGTQLSTNWSYKFRLPLEKIIAHSGLRSAMGQLFLLFVLISTSLFAKEEHKLRALYSSVDPGSLSKQLAFYELYPESIEGKKALHRIFHLLHIDQGVLTDLPLCSLDMWTSLVAGHPLPAQMKMEQVDFIEKLSEHFANRALLGKRAQTVDELASFPPEEIDVGRSILLHQCPEDAVLRHYEAFLDLMAFHIEARFCEGMSKEEKIRIINSFLFEEMQFRFPPHSLHVQDIDLYTFLPSVLDGRQGVCLGVSVLYICLAQRLGIELEVITPPGHIYVRIKDDQGECINIETTARGIDLPSSTYLGINTRLLQERNYKEVVGMVFINQAAKYWNTSNYEKALVAYKQAQRYVPDDPVLHLFMGLTYLFVGEEDKGRKMLESLSGYIFEEAVSKETIPEDYLLGRADIAALKAVFLPVDETRASIIKKQKELIEALERCPQFRAGLLQLATTWLQLGRTKEAMDVLERCNALDSSDATVSYYLAALALRRLDYQKAWHFLVQAESITSSRKHYPEALKAFRHSLRQLCPQ